MLAAIILLITPLVAWDLDSSHESGYESFEKKEKNNILTKSRWRPDNPIDFISVKMFTISLPFLKLFEQVTS